MSTTQKGIYYPNDYSEAADIPADMQTMAESIDAAIEDSEDEIDGQLSTMQQTIQENTGDISNIQEDISELNSTSLIIDEYEEVDVDDEEE